MKNIVAFLLGVVLFPALAIAQPGPIPSPWGLNGPTLFYNNGGVTLGNPVGGTCGVGCINVSGGLRINGVPLVPSGGGINPPTATILGGIYASSAGANQFASGIMTSGQVAYTQPTFGNLSGQAILSQLPSLGAQAVYCNATGGSNAPTSCTTLPTGLTLPSPTLTGTATVASMTTSGLATLASVAIPGGGSAGGTMSFNNITVAGTATLGTFIPANISTGNGTFTGTVNTNNLTVTGTATFSGTFTPNALAVSNNATVGGNLAVTGSLTASDRFRSLQSFGAVGNGIADDTAALSTALNSGKPLSCDGTFLIASLITITNVDVYIQGGNTGCKIVYSTAQSEIYATLTGANQYTSNKFVMRDVFLSINAQITSVTGPLKTAAVFIYYPLGMNGVTQNSVTMDNVQIKPTSTTNFVINGIYLYDVGPARLSRMLYEGNRTTFQTASAAYVYDGVNSPSIFTLEDSTAFYVERGVFAVNEATGGWQGVRVNNFDCVWCDTIIDGEGSADGTSDHIDLQSIEGTYNKFGIAINNVSHVFLHENYMFAMKSSGQATQATPTCMQIGQTISPTAYPAFVVQGNSCDASQYIGATTRYGVIINGFSLAKPVNGVLAPNTFSNMDIGELLVAGTAGVLVYPSSTLNVTTPLSNLSTAGSNSRVTSSSF